MPDFSKRSYQKELLDGTDIPFEDISRNMQELDTINSLLGGHAISIAGLRELLKSIIADKDDTILIGEIGCGGGDNIRALYQWCLKKNIRVRFAGVDINAECIRHAAQHHPGIPVQWIVSNYKDVHFEQQPDIIFSSLFCHHFSNEELADQLRWMKNNARKGFFINDLHRHPLAYHSIRILTKLFSKSYLVKNDAPLSVCRGFKKKEWEYLMSEAGIEQYSIAWKWAFRWLVLAKNQPGSIG